MKLIIDVSKETYIKANAGILGSLGEIIANGIPLQDGEFLLTLMQSVMTPEQLKEVLQKMVDERVGNFEQVKGDLISREALKKDLTSDTRNIYEFVCLSRVLEKIDNAPTVEPKLSDKQIEEITDLLENEWGYEGMKEDVTRLLRGAV